MGMGTLKRRLTMHIIYILIVCAHVNGGNVVTFQQFNSFKTCQEASKFVDQSGYFGEPNVSECVGD